MTNCLVASDGLNTIVRVDYMLPLYLDLFPVGIPFLDAGHVP